MRNALLVLMAVVLIFCAAASLTSVSQVEGNALHTMQNAWVIAESENSTVSQANVLSVTERTKKIVDALIVANASNDGQMTVRAIPAKWNAIRFRAIGITDDATVTHQIYLGTLGGGLDCELSHAGQLAWIIGTQQSIYDQIAFTDGGTYEPKLGDIVTGNTSTETAVVISKTLTSGTWAGGDAAGTITYRSASGTFTGGETVSILKAKKVLSSDAFTHDGGNLIAFELADTLVTTAGAWGAAWSTNSPANNTIAEAEIDVKGADFMVIVTSATTVDSKLLIKGY